MNTINYFEILDLAYSGKSTVNFLPQQNTFFLKKNSLFCQILMQLIKKILDLQFRVFTKLIILVLRCFTFLIKPTKTNHKIAALPYYPKNWPGGHDRIANWSRFFEEDNLTFSVFWGSNDSELNKFYFSQNEFKRYFLFYLCLFRRSFLFLKLLHYNTIWIQRAYIPYYPYKKPYFETLLSKYHPNVIFDYYDADYISNYDLTIESVKAANKVSVSTFFLKDKFSPFNKNTFLLNMTIDNSKIVVRDSSNQNNQNIRIGWMGNPNNVKHLQTIKKSLQYLSERFDYVSFHFLCRELPELNIKNLHSYTWETPNFNYNDWLSTIDIGIIPYIGDSDRLKAKSAMKTLEFMAGKTAIVTTEHGMFSGMKHNHHFLLASTENDWSLHLATLIEDQNTRNKLAENGYQFFLQNHTYENNYLALKKILTT